MFLTAPPLVQIYFNQSFTHNGKSPIITENTKFNITDEDLLKQGLSNSNSPFNEKENVRIYKLIPNKNCLEFLDKIKLHGKRNEQFFDVNTMCDIFQLRLSEFKQKYMTSDSVQISNTAKNHDYYIVIYTPNKILTSTVKSDNVLSIVPNDKIYVVFPSYTVRFAKEKKKFTRIINQILKDVDENVAKNVEIIKLNDEVIPAQSFVLYIYDNNNGNISQQVNTDLERLKEQNTRQLVVCILCQVDCRNSTEKSIKQKNEMFTKNSVLKNLNPIVFFYSLLKTKQNNLTRVLCKSITMNNYVTNPEIVEDYNKKIRRLRELYNGK